MKPLRLPSDKPKKIDTRAVDTLAFYLKSCRVAEPAREYRFAAMACGGIGEGVRTRLLLAGLKDWRFDFAWPDKMVALEMDGGGFVQGRHNQGAGMRADCEKLSTAVAMGWRVLRVDASHVKSGKAVGWVTMFGGTTATGSWR